MRKMTRHNAKQQAKTLNDVTKNIPSTHKDADRARARTRCEF